MPKTEWKSERIYMGFRWTDQNGRILLHKMAKPNGAFTPAVLAQNNYSYKILPKKWMELQQVEKQEGMRMSVSDIVSLAQTMIKTYFIYSNGADLVWLATRNQAKIQVTGACKLGYNAMIIAGTIKDKNRPIKWTNPITGELHEDDQLVWVEKPEVVATTW